MPAGRNPACHETAACSVISRAAVLIFAAAMISVAAVMISVAAVMLSVAAAMLLMSMPAFVISVAAGMALAVIMMMTALRVGIVVQASGQKRRHRFIRVSLHAGIQTDPRVVQRHPRAHSDPAADQRLHAVRLQKARQRSVSAALCADHRFLRHLSILCLIQLEALTMSEMLKNLSVFIGYRNFHLSVILSVRQFLHFVFRRFFSFSVALFLAYVNNLAAIFQGLPPVLTDFFPGFFPDFPFYLFSRFRMQAPDQRPGSSAGSALWKTPAGTPASDFLSGKRRRELLPQVCKSFCDGLDAGNFILNRTKSLF